MNALAETSWSPIAAPRWVRSARARHHPVPAVVRMLIAVITAWVPLVAFALLAGVEPQALLADLRVHARLLVSIPAMILCESVISRRLGLIARQVRAGGLLPTERLRDLTRIERELSALRDARWPQAALVAAAFAVALLIRVPTDPIWRLHGATALWYVAVSTPIFWFLLLRWIWRIGLWWRYVWHLSRLPVRITPSHPDGKGGLGFFSDGLTSFSWIAFAGGMPVVAAAYERGEVALGPQGLPHYVLPLIFVGSLVVVLVYAPLLFFSRRLRWHKRVDSLEFSSAALDQAHRFQSTWLQAKPHPATLLTAPDFSSVADLQNTYVRSEESGWFPVRVRSMLVVGLGALYAATPFLLLDHRLVEVAKRLLEALR